MKTLFAKDGFKFSAYLLLDFMILVAGYALAYQIIQYQLYSFAFLAAVLLGGRWHGVGILLHDCAHLAAYKTKKYNLVVGEILAPFVLLDFRRYQSSHLYHHNHLRKEDDPDYQKYMDYFAKYRLNKKLNLTLFIVLYPIVYIFFAPKTKFRAQFKAERKKRRGAQLYTLALQLSIFLILAQFEHMILFHLVTGYMSLIIKNIREIYEHHLIEENASRSFFNTDIILKNTVYLHNIGYHALHHRYPGVPFYRLPEAEKAMKTGNSEDIIGLSSMVKILATKKFKYD